MAIPVGSTVDDNGEVVEFDVEFIATIPTTRTAWSVTGDKPPSATLRLEIPASQFASVMKLMREGHERVLRFAVTIED